MSAPMVASRIASGRTMISMEATNAMACQSRCEMVTGSKSAVRSTNTEETSKMVMYSLNRRISSKFGSSRLPSTIPISVTASRPASC